MLKFTRRGWLASLVGAVTAAFLPRITRASAPAPAPIEPPPGVPRQRKRWIGHY